MTLDRTTLTLAIAVILIVFIGAIRPVSTVTGTPAEKLWAEKMLWDKQFDVVLAGDSRTYRGLSPGRMAEVLKNQRIGNFAFSATGFGEKYLERLPGLFRTDSSRKILVMGISPHCLTERYADTENAFLEYVTKNPLDLRVNAMFGDLLSWTRPYTVQELRHIGRKFKKGYFQHYYSDGWVASYTVPEKPDELVSHARRIWENNTVSPVVIDRFLVSVRKMRDSGIQVYGFRPPTSSKVREIENQRSGFQEEIFRQRFEQAGGIWLAIEPDHYHSYDGSHLRKDQALKLSSNLASQILADINRKSPATASIKPASKPSYD